MKSPSRDPLQPTCARCRARKVKCDGRMPRCSFCEHADIDCVVSSSATAGRYNRQYIATLQEKVSALQKREAELSALVKSEKSRQGRLGDAPRDTHISATAGNSHRESSLATTSVLNDHGMGFIHLIFAKIKSEVVNSRAPWTLRKHHNQPSPNCSSSAHCVPAETVQSLFSIYIRRAHSRYPFLDLGTITSLRERMLEKTFSPEAIRLSTEESFRAYAIMATAAIYQNQELSVCGTGEGVHNAVGPLDLFAVATASARQAIGVSLWDLTALTMRTCIECGFHRKPRARLPAFREQMQRRVFWQCYGLERYAGTTLGRPFSVPDEAITVQLPADVDDVALKDTSAMAPHASLDELAATQMPPRGLTDISVTIYHIQLRRISSRISHDYGILRHQLAIWKASPEAPRNLTEDLDRLALNGKVWNTYYQYLNELMNWKRIGEIHTHRDVGPDSNSDVFLHDSRWIDLHFHQERLFLIRLSIEPSSIAHSYFINPIDLLDELYDAASNTIVLYSQIVDEAKIEPTAGRLYRVLTAGLSILYTIIVESQISQNKGTQNTPPRPRPTMTRQTYSAKKSMLRQCTNTLDRMAKQITTQQLTPKYVGYFELLCRETLRILPKPQEPSLKPQDPAREDPSDVVEPNDAQPADSFGPADEAIHDISPEYFSSGLITAPLTCQLPAEHAQPCYCAVFADVGYQIDGTGPNAIPDFMASGMGVEGLYEYDPGMFVSEWGESTQIWEALFGNGQATTI